MRLQPTLRSLSCAWAGMEVPGSRTACLLVAKAGYRSKLQRIFHRLSERGLAGAPHGVPLASIANSQVLAAA